MMDEERITRLSIELTGSDAQVNGPYQIWAKDSRLTDSHLGRISPWADLESLMVSGCAITDVGLDAICRFRRLKALDIGATRITSDAIASADLPTSIATLGLYDLPLTYEAANRIAYLPAIEMLNCNNCQLSMEAFERLAQLPLLHGFEALGCAVGDDVAVKLSRRNPTSLLVLDSGVWRNGDVKRPRTWKS